MESNQTTCPEKCRILLIGGGGREHALAWKLLQSSRCETLFTTDHGNGALSNCTQACPHKWDAKDQFALIRWCEKEEINLVVVGPEVPLAEGITDALSAPGRFVFGPCRAAAALEADKAFAKSLMKQVAVPTAEGRTFTTANSARRWILRGIDRELQGNPLLSEAYDLIGFMQSSDDRGDQSLPGLSAGIRDLLDKREEPCVVKATGLAAGKGVIVCRTTGEALDAVETIMCDQTFGAAGETILIEEMLEGQEVSVLALVDGKTVWVLDPCQDHKQVGEGDVGPNTGGMGAYCPTPVMTEELLEVVEQQVLLPIIDGLKRDDIEYRGVLYAGMMLTAAGPKVLEFNCRFGDPECQPLMTRLKGDLVELLWATAAGSLSDAEMDFEDDVACCVVMCSEGYPGSYEKGQPITGIEEAEASAPGSIKVFHAGTCVDDKGQLVTNGGRVLGVTARASTITKARDLANAACGHIKFAGAFWREDIGCRVDNDLATSSNS
ncbi:MAG: phosphoribosylamine--glycine ligase [Phycisphaerae bacterium]|nr:phosphoribosylamine--glycine ligase [Phycisphaerae bacterium]